MEGFWPLFLPVLGPAEGQSQDQGPVQIVGPAQVHSLHDTAKMCLTCMQHVFPDCHQA